MNPNNSVQLERLFKAVPKSYAADDWARKLVKGLHEEYAGSGYGEPDGTR